MPIRKAQLSDHDKVRDLYFSAFSETERETVADLAVKLLGEKSIPKTVSLVAESDVNLVGHISFSPVAHTNSENFLGYILAPLAVHPEFQKRGVGTELVETGLKDLTTLGVDIVFVYGDPQYYSRFGFESDIAAAYIPPYPLKHGFGWQAKPLAEIKSFPPTGRLTCVPALMAPQLW